MEPAALAVGLPTVAVQLFKIAIAGYTFLDEYLSVGKDSQKVSVKLRVQDLRLKTIGEVIGLDKENWRGPQQNKYLANALLDTLCNIAKVFDDSERLLGRYGLQRDETMEFDRDLVVLPQEKGESSESLLRTKSQGFSIALKPFGDHMSQYEEIIKSTQSSISVFRKCKWVLTDRAKFQKLVNELKEWNDCLEALLPQIQKNTATELLNYDVLSTDDHGFLGDVQDAEEEDNPELSKAAAFKAQLVDQTAFNKDSPGLKINRQDLDFDDTRLTDRTMALWLLDGAPHSRVLIEWVERDFVHKEASEQVTNYHIMIERISRLVEMLGAKSPRAFRALVCAGYHISSTRIGLVYRLPTYASGSHPPLSLAQLLKDKKSASTDYPGKPALELRFKLAHLLAQAISGLHLANWIHKSICAEKILFFPKDSPFDVDISLPLLTGFDYARDLNETGLSQNAEAFESSLYRHPEHHLGSAYKKSYDIYAFGLVLLQIALWAPLEVLAGLEIKEEKAVLQGQKELRERLQKRCISGGLLQHRMGTAYKDAVVFCLNMGFDQNSCEDVRPSAPDSFFSMVVCKTTDLFDRT